MRYDVPFRKETLSKNPDGTYTVKGGGWFWVRFSPEGYVIETAQGMMEKKAAPLFLRQAKLTFEKYRSE